MSKHERQHSVSSVPNTTISNENLVREAKRARFEKMDSLKSTNWSRTLFVNTQFKDEHMRANDEQHNGFSSCFLTDKLLIPDDKKSLTSQKEKSE